MTAFPERFNLASWLLDERVAEGKGADVAVIDGENRITYRELQRLVNRLGNGLLELDVDMEDRVLIVLPDGIEIVAAWLATVKIGAVAVTTHPWWTTQGYERLLDVTRARTLVIDGRHRAGIEEAIPSSRYLRRVITVGEPESKEVAWEKLASSRLDDLDASPTHPEDVAIWFVHDERPIAHTHRGLATDADRTRTSWPLAGEAVLCRHLLSSPIGVVSSIVHPLASGGTIVAVRERIDPSTYPEIRSRSGATVFVEPRANVSGSAVCAEFEHRRANGASARYSAVFSESALICLLDVRNEGATGFRTRAVEGCVARVLQADLSEAPRGEKGVLWVKQEGVTPQFWHDETRTRREYRDGWLRVGEEFSVDTAGCVWYHGPWTVETP